MKKQVVDSLKVISGIIKFGLLMEIILNVGKKDFAHFGIYHNTF